MPTMPVQVPTDNLYKFLAIAGLLLFATGALVPEYMRLEYLKAQAVHTTQLMATESATRDVEREFNAVVMQYATQINVPIAELEQQIREASSQAERTRLNRRLAQLRERTVALRADLDKKFREITAAGDKAQQERMLAQKTSGVLVREYKHWLEQIQRWKPVVMSVGGVLILLGFFLWWSRLQRHQDAELKARATIATNNNGSRA